MRPERVHCTQPCERSFSRDCITDHSARAVNAFLRGVVDDFAGSSSGVWTMGNGALQKLEADFSRRFQSYWATTWVRIPVATYDRAVGLMRRVALEQLKLPARANIQPGIRLHSLVKRGGPSEKGTPDVI